MSDWKIPQPSTCHEILQTTTTTTVMVDATTTTTTTAATEVASPSSVEGCALSSSRDHYLLFKRASKRSRLDYYYCQYPMTMMAVTTMYHDGTAPSSSHPSAGDYDAELENDSNGLLLSKKDNLFFRNLRRIMSARRIQRAVRSKLRFAYTKVYASAFLTPNVGLPLDFVRSSRWVYPLIYSSYRHDFFVSSPVVVVVWSG